MLDKIIFFMFLCFIYKDSSIGFIKADELENFSDVSKKHTLSICAIFKNQAESLKEWIEYHHDLGVDHFYLYNIGSKDSFLAILRPYIIEGLVTLVNWPEALSDQDDNDPCRWALSTQIPAYENAVNFMVRDETKWLVFVDMDEFLVCPGENIKDLLNKYDDYPGISLSSDFFEVAIPDTFSKRELVAQSLEPISSPTQIIDKSVAKMIFKPDVCMGFIWPPYQCRFKNLKTATSIGPRELRINHYINRNIK